jgi:two-component system chemotaxis response regulator CheB
MTIRVLVADDSATMRSALVQLLSAEPDLVVVGFAQDGVEAIDKARALRPDVITMDVDMPRLDGLGAIAAIMREAPARVLVICSVSEERQLDLSFRAMAAGALELIAKPAAGPEGLRSWGRRVAESVRLMAEVPVVRRFRPGEPRPLVAPADAVEVVGVVASTGGPPALAQILSDLRDLCAPLLIAQHIAEGFTAGLVRWLASVTRLHVAIAVDGEKPRPGHVYLAPDGCDLAVGPGGVLRTARGAALHCPSGNRLLLSIAQQYGARAAGLVLTGMGEDGAQGLLSLREAGGQTFAQDEASSVVYGMPQAAWACGAARQQLALDGVPEVLRQLCSFRKE